MSCGFDKELLTGYFDGELEAAGKAEVERHIGACSECLRELGEIKSAAALVKGLPRLRAPRSVADGVSRDLAASGGRVHTLERTRRRLWWLTAAAAAAFVTVNVSYFLGRAPEGRPTPAAPMLGVVKAAKEEPSADEPVEKQKSGRRELSEDARKFLEGKDGAVGGAPVAPMPAEAAKKALAQDQQRLAAPAAKRAEEPREGGALAKSEEKAPEPAPGSPAKPAAPAAPLAPAASAPAPAGTPVPKPKPAPVAKADSLRQPAPVPEALTLAWVGGTASKARLDEILAKYAAPKPAAEFEARSKKPEAAAPADPGARILELTPETYEALMKDLEKAGGAKLFALSPEDPVLAKLAVPTKDVASNGGAKVAAAQRGPAPKSIEPERKDKASEAKVRVRISLLQVRELPSEPAK